MSRARCVGAATQALITVHNRIGNIARGESQPVRLPILGC